LQGKEKNLTFVSQIKTNIMNAIDIIKGMCQNGTTEQMGVISPINGDLNETINTYFGNEYKCINEGYLYYNVEYLYSYGERIATDEGETCADFVLMNDKQEMIYLYEIENI
jgi:hypothetical protein